MRIAALLSTACLAAAGFAAAPAAADDSLVGEWHLDTTAVQGDITTTPDSSQSGNDLTLNGGPQQVSDGRFGKAFQFANTSDRLQGGAVAPSALTAIAWVRSAAPGSDRVVMAEGDVNFCARAWQLVTTGGDLQFSIYDGTADRSSPSIPALSIWDGNWHAVAGSFDGSARAKAALDVLLRTIVEKGASDLHLKVGQPPMMRPTTSGNSW